MKKSLDRLLAGVLAFSMLLAPLPALAASPDALPEQTALTEPAPAEVPAPTEVESVEAPDPTPDAEPAPVPEPTADAAPTPAPDPADTEEPAPEPTPDVEPEATPEPAENAATEVTPQPAETATPETPSTPETPAPADEDGGNAAQPFGEPTAETMAADANGFTVENGILKKYEGTGGDIVIPTGVTEIAANVFKNNTTITGVTFPSSLRTIGESAFNGCTNLGEVTLNEGLQTIGDNAFENAAMGYKDNRAIIHGSLKIPSSVQSIGHHAFHKCSYLKEVTFDQSDSPTAVTFQVDWQSNSYAFAECPVLEAVTLPDSLTSLGGHAFYSSTALKSVTLETKKSTLATIGSYAFTECSSLEGIVLPASVKTIDESAFSKCTNLGTVTLNEGLQTIGNGAFRESALGRKGSNGKIEGKLSIPSTVQTIGDHAFYKCSYLKEVVFEQSAEPTLVTFTGDWRSDGYAFAACPELETVTLPDHVEGLKSHTFDGCTSLREVTFERTESILSEIGSYAFTECSSLEGIVLPASVKTIDESAFSKCTSLGIVTLNEGLQTIGNGAFRESALGRKGSDGKIEGKLSIPSTVQTIGDHAFYKCSHLKEVVFEQSEDSPLVTFTGDWQSNGYAFAACPELETVTLPDHVEGLKSHTFDGCTSLREVTFERTESILSEIGSYAFTGCSSLEGIVLPASVKTIDESAFSKCTSLGIVTLNEGLQTIGNGAFRESALGRKGSNGKIEGKLSIPSTVQTIGDHAFYKCSYLKEVIFDQSDDAPLVTFGKDWQGNSYAFAECPELVYIILPVHLENILGYTFYNCPKLKVVSVTNMVT